MNAVKGLLVLLGFQYLGEVAVYLAGLPVPGAVVGMLMLLVALICYGSVPEFLKNTATLLLSVLSLFLVPPSVGLVAHVELLGQYGWPIAASLFISTLMPMVVVAGLMKRSAKSELKGEGGRDS